MHRRLSFKQNLLIFLLIAAVSTALHWQYFDLDLIGIHIWRQSQTMWNVHSFYRDDFNILNTRCNILQDDGLTNLYRYEFPIMQWCIAGIQKIFHTENILTVRLFLFILGLGSVLGFFRFLRNVFHQDIIAWCGACAFCFSPLFYFYTINPIPDNMALFGIVWFLNFFQKYLLWRRNSHLLWAAFFLSLSAACKLPYIVLAAGVPVYLLGQRSLKEWGKITAIFLLLLLPTIVWYIWVIPGWGGNGILKGITGNQISWEKAQSILLFHFNVMFPEKIMSNVQTCLFVFGIAVMLIARKWKQRAFYYYFFPALACLLYFLFELNMIDTFHDYYMLPFVPVIFIVVAFGIKTLSRFGKIGQILCCGLIIIMPIRAFHTAKGMWTIEQSYVNPAIFTHQQELKNAVPDSEPCIITNDLSSYIYSYKLNKRGAMFGYVEITPEDAKRLIVEKQYRYMYSDKESVNQMMDSLGYIDSMIYQAGTIKVFHLKVPGARL